MKRVVLDSTILVSAFLVRGGAAEAFLHIIRREGHTIILCDDILKETARALLTYPRIRKRYHYSDNTVRDYLVGIEAVSQKVIPARVTASRDPNDDVIIGCAIRGHADSIITRDKDLLSLKVYRGIKMLTPEEAHKTLK